MSQPAQTPVSRFASFTPRRLLTSHLNARSASILLLLCAPPLLLTAAMSLPSLIFASPEQNAYFYFGKIINQDLSSSFALWMAAICLLFAVALPAPNAGDDCRTRG
ncbi:MAG: hypothetical protein V4640_08630 [Verrucomicrobiota bacterium]